MKRPAFQFYPDNWRNNSNLRRCSWAARGVWIEVMCLMHDAGEYGVLSWSLKEIGQALGCPPSLLRELVQKGVLKGCDEGECAPYIYTPRSGRRDGAPVTLVAQRLGPVWYSSRMVRDEYVRIRTGGATRFGSNGDTQPPALPPPKPSPLRRHGERSGDGASTPTSSLVIPSPTGAPPSPQESLTPHTSPDGDDRGVDLLVAASPAPTLLAEAVEAWNGICGGVGLPRVSKLTDKRKVALRKVLREEFKNDLARWRSYLRTIAKTPFMLGEEGRSGWRANFDFAVRKETVVRLREGAYGNKPVQQAAE